MSRKNPRSSVTLRLHARFGLALPLENTSGKAECALFPLMLCVVSPDGQLFQMDTALEEPISAIAVILNWKPKP